LVASAPKEKTLKEIIEERETELKELEQQNTIQDSTYMEALAEDIEVEQKPEKKTETAKKATEDLVNKSAPN